MYKISVNFWSYIVYRYNFDKHKNEWAYFALKKKHKAIEHYLMSKYFYPKKNVLLNNSQYNKYVKKNSTIWTFWWQGEEMPDVIRIAINSQKRYSNGHSLIVVSKENINDYIKLPQNIWDKFYDNKISITHLSDIVRFCLLDCYGGVWLDATVFVSQSLDSKIFEYEYYTIKMPRERYSCVSEFRWNGAIMAAKAGSRFCQNMCSLFYTYWENEESLIDYFLIDYFTDLVFQYDALSRQCYIELPMNSCNVFLLEEKLNMEYTKELYSYLMNCSVFHKLARREEHITETIDKKRTIWGHIKSELQQYSVSI